MTPFGVIASGVEGSDFAANEVRRVLRDVAAGCEHVDIYPRSVGRQLGFFLRAGAMKSASATDDFLKALTFAERGLLNTARTLESSRISLGILLMDRLVDLRLAEEREKS